MHKKWFFTLVALFLLSSLSAATQTVATITKDIYAYKYSKSNPFVNEDKQIQYRLMDALGNEKKGNIFLLDASDVDTSVSLGTFVLSGNLKDVSLSFLLTPLTSGTSNVEYTMTIETSATKIDGRTLPTKTQYNYNNTAYTLNYTETLLTDQSAKVYDQNKTITMRHQLTQTISPTPSKTPLVTDHWTWEGTFSITIPSTRSSDSASNLTPGTYESTLTITIKEET